MRTSRDSSHSAEALRTRVRRSLSGAVAGSIVHRFYSCARGLSYSSADARGRRTATEHLQHGLMLEDRAIEAGQHRRLVGGRWDQIGRIQLDFLVAEGLRPEHVLIDIGCGALRAGVHLIRYLEPGNYYGIDINPSLLRAGRWELAQAGLADRCASDKLRATDDFDCDFGRLCDYALAQSLFTHISLSQIERCLERVAGVMKPGGRFFASYNGLRPGRRLARPSTRDPFRHAYDDLAAAGAPGVWSTRYIADWGHPRGMRMIEYRRT
jgi:SAM-dependent methyltransferase